MRAHIIQDGVVVNTVDVETLGHPEGLEMAWAVGNSDIGDAWDGEVYIKPLAPPLPPLDRHITNFAFRMRFTPSEKARIELECLDPGIGAPPAARLQAAGLRATLADNAAAKYKDLDRPETRDGVHGMQAAGWLDKAGRDLEILDGPIEDYERFNGPY